MVRLAWFGVAVAAAMAVACSEGEEPASDTQPADGRAVDMGAPGSGLIQGTPPGGLEDWLSEIEAGLPSSPGAPGEESRQVQRRLLDLYVGRQEYLEMYWGPTGRLQGEGGEALGEAILELETAFHELLQAHVREPLDTARFVSALQAAKARVAAVRVAAPQSGLVLVPPGNPPAAPRRE